MHCWAWKRVKEIPKAKMNKENLETKIRVKGVAKKLKLELQESRALGTSSSVRTDHCAGCRTWDPCITPESPKGWHPQRKNSLENHLLWGRSLKESYLSSPWQGCNVYESLFWEFESIGLLPHEPWIWIFSTLEEEKLKLFS